MMGRTGVLYSASARGHGIKHHISCIARQCLCCGNEALDSVVVYVRLIVVVMFDDFCCTSSFAMRFLRQPERA